jgi:hypothetical protein
MWMLTIGGVFLAIHLGRMPISDSLLGISSPFVATAGDLLMTLILAALVLLPARLAWRRLTRPVERLAWSLHLGTQTGAAPMNAVADWVVVRWLRSRFSFSIRLREGRVSLPAALILLLRLGLPVTAFFVAFNPIWGFSWYFNTESWATGIYQKLTELRVDAWRIGMIDAVARAHGGGGDELFHVDPDGIQGSGDFRFLVLRDSGEGDASQSSLIARYLELGRRDDVKFLVILRRRVSRRTSRTTESNFSSSVPRLRQAGLHDPGNHDWYDALEAFSIIFSTLRRRARRCRARRGRSRTPPAPPTDASTSSWRRQRVCAGSQDRCRYPARAILRIADRRFRALAIDTGILARSTSGSGRGSSCTRPQPRKLAMAIVGHPRFAAGRDTAPVADGHDVSESPKELAALYRLLASHGVRIAMAGDTHDFEYYRERAGSDGASRAMHHIVNGGGGAYLSIGTALDFPKQPATAEWAFYPRTDRLRGKMDAEMPIWKQPFWYWIKWLNAWPFSVEALSGIFDFNHAPFFQSFVEGGSAIEEACRPLLNGVGPLHWRDLQTSGGILPPDRSPRRPGGAHRADGS